MRALITGASGLLGHALALCLALLAALTDVDPCEADPAAAAGSSPLPLAASAWTRPWCGRACRPTEAGRPDLWIRR